MSELWKPHSYQLTAISFLLSNPSSGLFLDPGLGKTSTSLSAIKILKNSGSIKGVLMVAPVRVMYNVWPDEINKWSNFKDLSYTILHDETKGTIWGSKKDIYLVNPEALKWLHGELLSGLREGKKCPFDTIWIDESTKFKSHESNRFKYICDMLPLFKRRHIMTGTPSPKGLLNLWSQIYILDEGKSLKPNFHHFRNKYFESNDWDKYNWTIKDFSSEAIYEAVAPLVLNMSAKDYLDMPELLINDIEVVLPDKAFRHYKDMEKKFFIELDGMEATAEAAAQASMKCHQIANGRVYEDIPEGLDEEEIREFKKTRKTIDIHKSKLEALCNLVDELNGKPLLIAYYFKHDLEAIKSALGDVPYIGSGVSPKQTKKLVTAWNNGELPILLGHPLSMAHGLNLQAVGNDICWYSLTWSLEDYLQFVARIYRQGVTGSVRVHRLVGRNTLDEVLLSRLNENAGEQQNLRLALDRYRLRSNN
jgi:SNF2 family DNA or RNA helicase